MTKLWKWNVLSEVAISFHIKSILFYLRDELNNPDDLLQLFFLLVYTTVADVQ